MWSAAGAEELESFLRTQRALVQKTRDEIAEMKSFSDLRRAVKMHRDAYYAGVGVSNLRCSSGCLMCFLGRHPSSQTLSTTPSKMKTER